MSRIGTSVCANFCIVLAIFMGYILFEVALWCVLPSVLNWHYFMFYHVSRIGTFVCATFCLELAYFMFYIRPRIGPIVCATFCLEVSLLYVLSSV